MWRAPYRPNNQITQQYNSGIVKVYRVTDGAKPGYLPVERPALKVSLCYEELRAGLQRYYNAMQNQVQVERVIRVPRPPMPITTQDIAVTEDGRQYGIGQVQKAEEVYPPSLDVTLTAIEQKYEVEDGSEDTMA